MSRTLSGENFINGAWRAANGQHFNSVNPSDNQDIWSGHMSTDADVDTAFRSAAAAFEGWSQTPLETRIACVQEFAHLAVEAKSEMAELIARETGKVLWDATGEAGALSAKVEVSIQSYRERTGQSRRDTAFGHAVLTHRPHGVMAVLGPYNFPAHLPNGQIIPALLAGNTVVFKPSEQTPAVGEALIRLYAKAGFPSGVINLVQGARDTGTAVLNHGAVNGVLFTGSAKTGAYIHKLFGGRPEVRLALEMGGNNPLIMWDINTMEAAASLAVQSAFITTGQRCTCARRIILPEGDSGTAILDAITSLSDRVTIGAWDKDVTIGPLISADIAQHVVKTVEALESIGAIPIRAAVLQGTGSAYITPSIYDVTGCDVPDEEIFGPVMQIIRVKDWDAAIKTANATKFGLSAGLVTEKSDRWADFTTRINAGIVNLNRPTTGAASFLPFGGPGASGNHSPGAYYAADFCAWPMASQVSEALEALPMNGLSGT